MPESPRLLDQVRAVIRMRHYSMRTERSYCDWICRFIRFHPYRHPRDMGHDEITVFLSHLAVERITQPSLGSRFDRVLFLLGDGKHLLSSKLWCPAL